MKIEPAVTLPSLSVVMYFFFEASLHSYAGGGEYIKKFSHDPDHRDPEKSFCYVWPDKSLLYIDTYRSNGEFSSGETVIYVSLSENLPRTPLWTMSYHGWCRGDNKRFTRFLKERLRLAYEVKHFCGGRGESWSEPEADGLVYRNQWWGDFTNFHGIENIYEPASLQSAFWHRFQGLLMVPPNSDGGPRV